MKFDLKGLDKVIEDVHISPGNAIDYQNERF